MPDIAEDLISEPRDTVGITSEGEVQFDSSRFLDYLEASSLPPYSSPNLLSSPAVRPQESERAKPYRPAPDFFPLEDDLNDPWMYYRGRVIKRPEPISLSAEDYLPLTDVFDGRRFTMQPTRAPFRTIGGSDAYLDVQDPYRVSRKKLPNIRRLRPIRNPDWRLYYVDSRAVIPCIRRRSRRQVLFAKQHAGVGKSHYGKRRWKQESYFIC